LLLYSLQILDFKSVAVYSLRRPSSIRKGNVMILKITLAVFALAATATAAYAICCP
jgi:hypothetical protein